MNGLHMDYHVLQKFTKETLERLPILSLRINRTRNVPDSFNHPLYLNTLLGYSNPDRSVCLSPLYPSITNDLHVSIATSIHQCFSWLYSSRAACTILQVPTVKITVGRRCRDTQTNDTDNMCVAFALTYTYAYSFTCRCNFCTFLEKTESGTRTFHDVYCSKPLTFHNGWMFHSWYMCRHHKPHSGKTVNQKNPPGQKLQPFKCLKIIRPAPETVTAYANRPPPIQKQLLKFPVEGYPSGSFFSNGVNCVKPVQGSDKSLDPSTFQ